MPKMTFDTDQNRTNWTVGGDRVNYVTECKSSFPTPDMGGNPARGGKSAARESQVVLACGPKPLMASVNTTFFCRDSSAVARSFVKQGPAEGFDRLTAAKPQWELGAGQMQPYVTKSMDEHSDPMIKRRVEKKTQPRFHSLDRRVFDATTSLRKNRHDLGYNFNIVTCSPRKEERLPVGPRLRTSQDRDAYGDDLGFGNGGQSSYNLTQGRLKPKAAPPRRVNVNEGRVQCGPMWS